MAARRIGHVRWKASRHRWYIDLHYLGQRHYIYSFEGLLFYHKKNAIEALRLIQKEISTGTFDPRKYKRGAELTVRQYAEGWLDLLDLAPNTIRDYRYCVNNFIGPFFKDIDIRDVRHNHLMGFKKWLSARVSAKTAYNVMGCLKTCLRYAWRNQDIFSPPPFPAMSYTRPEIRWIDQATQGRIIESIPEADQPIFWFMAWYGVRPSEARALQKADLQGDHITIKHSYSLGKLRPTTKTNRVRILPRLDVMDRMIEAMPATLGSFLFTRKDGQPYKSRDLNRLWNTACEKVGVKINLYNGLKHSLGMILLEKGVSKDMVRKIYGHTRQEMTDRYCEHQTRQVKASLETVVQLRSAPRKPTPGKG